MHAPHFPAPSHIRPRRALLSVSDKAGLVDLARTLARHGVELVSTGGTAKALAAADLSVKPIESLTGFPEMMDGRVKTLHPKVHGGILSVRDNPEHQASMKSHDIAPIDILVINLYPFEQTIAKPGCSRAEAIENIDIGGPSMVRSAAKNHAYVAIVTDPADYARLAHELDTSEGRLSRAFLDELAAKAFALTARYDAAIAAYLAAPAAREGTGSNGASTSSNPSLPTSFPPTIATSYTLAQTLRYGENPHQAAALYKPAAGSGELSIASATQHHGKELSYNNINDAAAALSLAQALDRISHGRPAACVIKHANPCGASIADSPEGAVDEAIASDPLAAYGGILATNAVIDAAAAERLVQKDIFLEVVVAPGYSAEGLEKLKARSANIRLLEVGAFPKLAEGAVHLEQKLIPGGLLVQERDQRLTRHDEYQHRAGPIASEETLVVAAFMEAVTRSLLSNAVAIGGHSPQRPHAIRLFGAGAGQMDRVTSCRIAVEKAGANAKGGLAYSDAFFPFNDGPTILANAGVTTIVHPGGSKRDQDTFDLCQTRGITCLVTGIRHFRH